MHTYDTRIQPPPLCTTHACALVFGIGAEKKERVSYRCYMYCYGLKFVSCRKDAINPHRNPESCHIHVVRFLRHPPPPHTHTRARYPYRGAFVAVRQLHDSTLSPVQHVLLRRKRTTLNTTTCTIGVPQKSAQRQAPTTFTHPFLVHTYALSLLSQESFWSE